MLRFKVSADQAATNHQVAGVTPGHRGDRGAPGGEGEPTPGRRPGSGS